MIVVVLLPRLAVFGTLLLAPIARRTFSVLSLVFAFLLGNLVFLFHTELISASVQVSALRTTMVQLPT